MQALMVQIIRIELNNIRGPSLTKNKGNSQNNHHSNHQDNSNGSNLNIDVQFRTKLVEEHVKTPHKTFDNIEVLLTQPFTEDILTAKAPNSFKMPIIDSYDGLS